MLFYVYSLMYFQEFIFIGKYSLEGIGDGKDGNLTENEDCVSEFWR